MTGKLITVILVFTLIGALLSGCIQKPRTGIQPAPTATVKPAEETQEFEVIPQRQNESNITLSCEPGLYPVAVRLSKEFQKQRPEVKVEVVTGGADKSLADVVKGLADIGMFSGDSLGSEKDAYTIAVAKDAVVPVINSRNPVLKDILSKGIKRKTFIEMYTGVTTWGEVARKPEITEKVNVYTRSDAGVTPRMWAEYLGMKSETLKGIGIHGEPALLAAVQNDPLGAGFISYGRAFDMNTGKPAPGIQVIPIDVNENGVADPAEDISTKEKTVTAIKKDIFPRPLTGTEYFVTKVKPTGLEAEFIKWSLTDGQKYLDKTGYVALPEETLGDEVKKIE